MTAPPIPHPPDPAGPPVPPAVAPPELVVAAGHEALVWRLAEPALAVSTSPVGGGIGLRSWVLNVQVPISYDRTDVAEHLLEVADAAGLAGEGIGLLTAASVDRWTTATDPGGARVDATVGIGIPTWAAAEDAAAPVVGTINVVGRLDRRLGEAALVNAVATVTEAKVQALLATGVDGTGTASDAVCLLCPPGGDPEAFGGPRSTVGAPLARATHRAVVDGVARFRHQWGDDAGRAGDGAGRR